MEKALTKLNLSEEIPTAQKPPLTLVGRSTDEDTATFIAHTGYQLAVEESLSKGPSFLPHFGSIVKSICDTLGFNIQDGSKRAITHAEKYPGTQHTG